MVTLANVANPGRISPKEPMAEQFSAAGAARYLDTAALYWAKSRKCVSCHTDMGYLFARPALRAALRDSGEVRARYERYVTETWQDKRPAQTFNVVVLASALAFNDAQTTGKLHETTRRALELMWKVQRDDGGWKWLKCGWPPMEYDDHYGVTLAALAVGMAPEEYARTDTARAGLEKVRSYLANNPPPSLHHRAMIAWASQRIDGLMSDEQRAKTLEGLLALQRPDGGWSTPGLLSGWKGFRRKDRKPHDTRTSDAYATGFVIVVARSLETPASHFQLQRGIGWLLAKQRVSGKWFTPSPTKDSRHYISNFGTAFAVLALQSCDRLPR
jgi:squalene-hopene/tetraprenyl-beta-curcumene cyclase